MIFRPELAKLILQGRKTMTRRQIGDRPVCRYEAGKSYAVQPGRGKLAVCRITVTEVRRERLGDMPIEDARREGFSTRQEFFDYWASLYGRVDRDLEVWVIRFVLGDHTDKARFLAARMGGPEGDYTMTSHRAINEPLAEPVDEATLQRFGKAAQLKREQGGALAEAEKEAAALHERLKEVERKAAARKVDVSRQVAAIHRRLERLQRPAA